MVIELFCLTQNRWSELCYLGRRGVRQAGQMRLDGATWLPQALQACHFLVPITARMMPARAMPPPAMRCTAMAMTMPVMAAKAPMTEASPARSCLVILTGVVTAAREALGTRL